MDAGRSFHILNLDWGAHNVYDLMEPYRSTLEFLHKRHSGIIPKLNLGPCHGNLLRVRLGDLEYVDFLLGGELGGWVGLGGWGLGGVRVRWVG